MIIYSIVKKNLSKSPIWSSLNVNALIEYIEKFL